MKNKKTLIIIFALVAVAIVVFIATRKKNDTEETDPQAGAGNPGGLTAEQQNAIQAQAYNDQMQAEAQMKAQTNADNYKRIADAETDKQEVAIMQEIDKIQYNAESPFASKDEDPDYQEKYNIAVEISRKTGRSTGTLVKSTLQDLKAEQQTLAEVDGKIVELSENPLLIEGFIYSDGTRLKKEFQTPEAFEVLIAEAKKIKEIEIPNLCDALWHDLNNSVNWIDEGKKGRYFSSDPADIGNKWNETNMKRILELATDSKNKKYNTTEMIAELNRVFAKMEEKEIEVEPEKYTGIKNNRKMGNNKNAKSKFSGGRNIGQTFREFNKKMLDSRDKKTGTNYSEKLRTTF